MLKIDDALKELATKSYTTIQVETAWKWASRAAASFNNATQADPADKVAMLLSAEEYYHEAIEHASLADVDGLVNEIKTAIGPYASAALQSAVSTLGINL